MRRMTLYYKARGGNEGVCEGVGSNKIVSLLYYLGADVSGFNVQFFGL